MTICLFNFKQFSRQKLLYIKRTVLLTKPKFGILNKKTELIFNQSDV